MWTFQVSNIKNFKEHFVEEVGLEPTKKPLECKSSALAN